MFASFGAFLLENLYFLQVISCKNSVKNGKICTMLSRKYGLSSDSIFVEVAWYICRLERICSDLNWYKGGKCIGKDRNTDPLCENGYSKAKTGSVNEDKTLSDTTIHHHHGLISSILSCAVQWQVIFSNPCDRVKPPKIGKPDPKYLDEEQARHLIEWLQDEGVQFRVMIELLMFTGLRRGELLGLEWSLFNKQIPQIQAKARHWGNQHSRLTAHKCNASDRRRYAFDNGCAPSRSRQRKHDRPDIWPCYRISRWSRRRSNRKHSVTGASTKARIKRTTATR